MTNEAKNTEGPTTPEAGETPKEPPYAIMSLNQYEDTKGRRIREQVPVSGDMGHDWARFVGYVTFHIQAGGQNVKVDTELPIPGAENILEAFAKFDDTAKKREPEIKQNVMAQLRQKAQPGIVTAKNMPPMGGMN